MIFRRRQIAKIHIVRMLPAECSRRWVRRRWRGGGGGEAILRGGTGAGRVFLGIAPWLLSSAGDRRGQKGGATVSKTDGWTNTHQRQRHRQMDRQAKTMRKAETDGIPDHSLFPGYPRVLCPPAPATPH